MAFTRKLSAIGDAIRSKTGKTGKLSLDAMPSEIMSIVTGGSENVIVDNPQYFQTEIVETLKSMISRNVSNKLVIFHITDSHIYTNHNNKQYFDAQMASMLAVAKVVKPDLVVHGGDMTEGSESKAVTFAESDNVVKQMREVGGDNTLILIGNHDGNYVSPSQASSEMITEAEMLLHYRYWNDGFIYPTGKLYGYRDYTDKGIRVIRLHSYMGDGTLGGTGSNWGYPSDEVAWFRDVALDTNLNILILSHQTLSPVLQGYDESQDIPHNGTQLQTLIDNWQNSIRKCCGVIHGHVHWDYSSKGNGTFTVIDHNTKEEFQRMGSHGNFYEHGLGLANFQTATAEGTPASSYRDVPKNAISYERKANDKSQALWSVIIVDSTHVSIIRFGAGNDRSYNYQKDEFAIITQPQSITVEEGTDVEVSIITNDSETTYFWEFYHPLHGWNSVLNLGVNDDRSQTIHINGSAITMDVNGYKFRCTVSNGSTDIVSDEATLTIIAKPVKVNALTLAIDSNGNPYNNGQGWKSGYRLSSSGGESAASGMFVTGFIPATKGKKLTFKNIHLDAVNTANCYINVYNSSKTLIKANYAKDWVHVSSNSATKTPDGAWVESLYLNEGVGHADISATAYVRFSAPYIGTDTAIYIE